jgi:NADH-quinone oxidoreductase subunit C
MNQTLQDLGEYIQSALPQAVTEILQDRDELILVSTRAGLVRLMTFLRDDSNSLFKVLIDICGVDYPERTERFDIVYNLLSMRFNQRIRIKVRATEDDLVPSIVGVFSSANWYEREVWDLYGVMFSDHPDLRRILTDYGFEGHPMRKDFPLTGHVEVRYDEAQKRVVYEPVKLTQAFRSFDFMSPWEGAEYILPGDEKADDSTGGAN